MKETKNEKDLSTVEITTRTHSRLPLTDGNERRESSNKQAPCERQAQTCDIIITCENKIVDDTTVIKPSFSFPKKFRLRLKNEFQVLYTRGKRTRGKIMTLIVHYPPENQEFKAGFTVRKKFYKRAVDRNKIKRRLREIVRLNRSKLSQNIWFVVHAERGILDVSWQTLADEYNELCRKAGIIND